MYSYCSNNLLNTKDFFIKKVVHADFFVKVFIETRPYHKPVHVVVRLQREFMITGYKQSRIFLFRQNTVFLFFGNADMSAPAAKSSMRIIPFCHVIFREQID